MESRPNIGVEVNQAFVRDLMEFGFPREEATLALKINQNDKERAAELLMSGGVDLQSLQALAQIAV